jgi:TrmH family RNA methyltransferase
VVTNLQIKFIKSLHLKKNRLEYGQYICEGEKIVQELIKFKPECIETVYAMEDWSMPVSAKNVPLERVTSKDLEKMSQHTTVPSVIALVNFPKKTSFQLLPQKFHLYLDQIADPGNLGTIIRTADWYGHKQLFLSPNSVDLYNSKVIQSAMGSHFRIQCLEINFKELLANHSFSKIYATAMEGKNLNEVSDISKSLVIMGSESHGVSGELLAASDSKVTIPSFGPTESLNVAVATGIILHQFTTKL